MLPPTASAVSQGLVMGQEAMVTSHMNFYLQPSPPPSHLSLPPNGFHQSMGSLNSSTSWVGGEAASHLRGTLNSMHQKHTDGGSGQLGASSGQRSTSNPCLSVGGIRMKKVKARRKVREPRFSFKTMSEVDVLDDGYKWRKYGQKVVKNTQHPRSYYRCVQDSCRVKKRVERLAEDPRMVITTYEGRHAHSPSRGEDECRATSHINFFW